MKLFHYLFSPGGKLAVTISLLFTLTSLKQSEKPVLYIIGDSTVQNNDGNGKNEYWGWGTLLNAYLDTTQITLRNHAKSGTSTRTFITDGRWTKVLATLKSGDFVIMQFGHNDQAEINDSSRAKGTIKGTGEEIQEIFNLKTKTQETVHTYGWYMRKFIREAKEKGTTPIVCSLVPREKWKNGKVDREIEYVNWAQEVARSEGAYFIDINQIIVKKWEQMGPDAVKVFFPGDHTHTNKKGAELNAASVVEGLRSVKDCPLNKFLK
ncbi:rhamnogalacturonan acetylesterase [Niastella sp. OAS944]|uniref:rhamnogalacturonan acetylesterase n=1 Tax=Niastella sp. OAS944 TaxID=2664089 RepID=UPI0034959A6E|nr:lysophospholipase L1-like esterase [Chitinophagaceae bacterium OAS944]